jgi:hypothetical protein
MSDYQRAFRNLKNYDKETGTLVLELYNKVSVSLKELIPDNSKGLRQAQRELMTAYNEALLSTNFVEKFKASTVQVIVNSSYVRADLGGTKQVWADYLWDKSMFSDNVKLSKRIRNNSINIVRDQRAILNKSLKEGKSIAKIVGNIGDDTLKGFTRELPKYIDELRTASIAGESLKPKHISAIKAQAKRIKTEGLKADYLRLIDAIELDKNIDKAVYYAMERRTKYYASRVARSETIRTMAVQDTHIALQNKDTHLVKNITQGDDPCPFCVASENMGFVPVESATISTHHPHCSCVQEFKRTMKKPEKWSDEKFIQKQQSQINKVNAEAERKGKPKTYLQPISPTNLRETDLLKDWNEFKSRK